MLERPLYISALLILMTVCLTQYLSFPWGFVTSLFWERYPNPYAKHVLSEDVLERRFLPDGKLYTKRFIPKGQVLVVEESIIDVKAKRIDVVSENFGSSKKYLSVKEYCSLVPSEDDHSATQFARILIPGFSLKGFLRSAVMKAAHSYYNSSSKDTYMGYMHICKMYSNTCHSQKSNLQANDVPRSSVRVGSTPEFTSSKLPQVVVADSGSNK